MNPQATRVTPMNRVPLTIRRGSARGKGGKVPAVRDSELKTKPNKAKWDNSSYFKEMYEKFIKQSQRAYLPFFQLLAAHFMPFFREK
jgi:hypothetical protein